MNNYGAVDSPGPRLRIAVLNRIFKSTGGGAERYSIALVEQLAARHEIHVFAQHIEHQWPGITYHRIGQAITRPRWINQLWFAFATWVATRHGFDVVHSHENTWHGQVQTVHVLPLKHTLFHGRKGVGLALRWLKVATSPRLLTYLALEHFRYARQPGRTVVPASSTLQAILAATYPKTVPAMQVVTPGVNHVPGPASAAQRQDARRQLGLPLEGKCVLFVGNDYRKKGLPGLLQAMQALPQECYLAVVGNAAQIAGLQGEVASLGLVQRTFFLGALASVDTAYQAADCLAHPTLEDTFAMVVLEALAHGLPVVVSDKRYCGISELLTDQANALILANPTEAAALAQALIRALFDAPTRATLSDAGCRFASQHQWSQSALQQERIYRHAAGAGLRPRQVVLLDASRKRLNAGPKARLDTAVFLAELGFEIVTVPQSRSRQVRKWISLYLRYLSNLNLPRNAVVWCQFPPESTTKIVLEQARQRGLQTVVFIHDLEGLKPASPNWERVRAELEEVRQYTKVLSLNKKISAILQSYGIEAAAELECWDYHCEEPVDRAVPADRPLRVVYAGNLSSYKSGFIYQLGAFPSVKFELFGQGLESGYSLPDNIRFAGVFNPDTPPLWAGKYFGLIWDGVSTDACRGNYGAYLAFNTPHKAALYLSRDMPVIVWREACIAALIDEHHAGLLVSSLNELESRLATLTPTEYDALKRGAIALGKKVRSGYFIQRAALQIVNGVVNPADQIPANST